MATFDLLLFDLDGTLYDQSNGYEDNVHGNIFKYMVQAKGGKFDQISTIEEAKMKWHPIFEKYNLTKRGLLGEGYVFDNVEYDRFIRQGAKKFITKDPELRIFLESLPQRKVIFTNAPEESANEILDLLGVADLFEAVLGTDFLQHRICKPEKEAFARVLNHLGVKKSDYHRVCYFEDSFKNLEAGKDLGFGTIFILSTTLESEGRSRGALSKFDAVINGKVGMGLKNIFPKLWG
jgi:pyrimidine 5'-nucleotidase